MRYEIKKVKIGFLSNLQETGIIQNGRVVYRYEKTILNEDDDLVCIVDSENGVAINVNDYTKKYPILKRNKHNQIADEFVVKENEVYVLDMCDLEKDFKTSIKNKKQIKRYLKSNR